MAETASLVQKDRAAQTTPESTRGVCFTPRVDIYETDNELTLYADVPGVAPGGVELRYENGELVLNGRVQPRQSSRARPYHQARRSYPRAVALARSVD